MPSTYSDRLRIELMASGEKNETWGAVLNDNALVLLEEAIAGVVTVTHNDAASYTLSALNADEDESRNMVIIVGGALTSGRNVVCPAKEKLYVVRNATTGGFPIVFKTPSGSGVEIPNGASMLVYCDAVNVINAVTNLPSGTTIGGATVLTETSTSTLTNKTISGGTLTGTIAAGSLTISLTDNLFTVQDNGDATKRMRFEVSGVTAGQTRVFTVPDYDATLATIGGAETLTNKTLTGPVISGGTINNTPIGGTTRASVAATTGDFNGAVTFAGGQTISATGADFNDTEVVGASYAVNEQTGTTYTLAASDNGLIVSLSNASAITVALPPTLPKGFACTLFQKGAGQVTVLAQVGATLMHRQSHTKLAGQYAVASVAVEANVGGSAAAYLFAGDTAS